jgi:hypothetical protein
VKQKPVVKNNNGIWEVYHPNYHHYGEIIATFDTEKEADDYAENYDIVKYLGETRGIND